jgi:hypothetical protein
MTAKKETKGTAWKPGQSGNMNGRPKGTGRPVSRLRGTLNKLKGIEPEAIAIIEGVVKGDLANFTKDQIDMAKWIIAQINSLTRGAIAEESFKIDSTPQREQEEQANGTTGAVKPRFSLNIVDEE